VTLVINPAASYHHFLPGPWFPSQLQSVTTLTGWPQTWKTVKLGDFSEHVKLLEFSENSVQPQVKIILFNIFSAIE